ncbi:NUDIX hydrolase [Candidatus Woesearchaeota archaeon]|nr:NUDIX hydrolase [Candidatus Woesearchaeota archaeon]
MVVDLIIINDENEVFLVKRSKNTEHFPECWSFPGGKIDGDEDKETALRREIKEELNVKISEMKFFKSYDYILEGKIIHANYYVGKINGKIGLNKREISEARWFKISPKLLKLKWAFNQREVMADFLDLKDSSRPRNIKK